MEITVSDITLRNCNVQLNKIEHLTQKECFVSVVKCKLTKAQLQELKSKKLTKEEKYLLLPHKKSQSTKKSNTKAVKKGAKFQLKITSFFGDNKKGRVSPDSGVSSRAESPETDDDENNSADDTLNDSKAKDDFLKSIDKDDESGVDEESSSDGEDSGSDWEDGKEDIKPKYTKVRTKKAPVKCSVIHIEKSEKGEYELKRDQKIKEKEAMMAALKAQWQNFKAATEVRTAASKPRQCRPKVSMEPEEVRRSGRVVGTKPEYDELNDDWRPPSNKKLRYGFDEENYRPAQKEGGNRTGQGKTILDPNVDMLMPEDVTQAMLKKIHFGGRKTYDSATGTCCHQCRQKTTDTKTVCRSGHCIGVRGQFCGTCLNNRYGESVAEALKDPDWTCPPCRNICNCSFCLETPTGQLFYIAREKGFKSVHHYLENLRAKWDNDED